MPRDRSVEKSVYGLEKGYVETSIRRFEIIQLAGLGGSMLHKRIGTLPEEWKDARLLFFTCSVINVCLLGERMRSCK